MSDSVAFAKAKTREWPSYHGHALPLRSDPFATGLDFVRALHHRLCQPLTSLNCALELMQLGRESDKQLTEHIQAAMTQSEKVNEVMSVFRQMFEAEAEASLTQVLSLDSCLGEIAAELAPLAEAYAVRLRTVEAQGEDKVSMSRNAAQQVLWGVLEHCIEASVCGTEILISRQESQLVIADEVHSPEDAVANAFDPFSYTINAASKRATSNLPLALAQRLMLAANGELIVANTKDGRRFTLLFSPARSVTGS